MASLPGHGGWQGNSKVTENGSHPLDTVVKWPNGTKIRYPAGNDITITLREVVAMAGGADENGVATPIALNDVLLLRRGEDWWRVERLSAALEVRGVGGSVSKRRSSLSVRAGGFSPVSA